MALPDVPQPNDLDETFKQLNYFMDGMFKHNAFAPPVSLHRRAVRCQLMSDSTITAAGGGCDARHKCGTMSAVPAVEPSSQMLTCRRSPTSTTSARCTKLCAKSSGEAAGRVGQRMADASSRDGKLDKFEVPETSTVQQAEDLPTHDE